MTKDEGTVLKDKVDYYLNAIDRLEPDLVPVDELPILLSIAISLKRIADHFDKEIEDADTKETT